MNLRALKAGQIYESSELLEALRDRAREDRRELNRIVASGSQQEKKAIQARWGAFHGVRLRMG